MLIITYTDSVRFILGRVRRKYVVYKNVHNSIQKPIIKNTLKYMTETTFYKKIKIKVSFQS
jgi:predicted site-specific integrase-resolvase